MHVGPPQEPCPMTVKAEQILDRGGGSENIGLWKRAAEGIFGRINKSRTRSFHTNRKNETSAGIGAAP